MGATGEWNLDAVALRPRGLPAGRATSRSTYYEIWLAGLERLLAERGLVSEEEIAAGPRRSRPTPVERTLAAQDVGATLGRGGPTEREAPRPARFAVGRPRAGPQHAPADPHPPAALRARPRRDGRARARLPRLPRRQRARRRRGPAVALHGALRRRASCGARDADPTVASRSTRSSPTWSRRRERRSRSSASRGRRRRSRSPSRCTSAACSPGRSGPPRSPRRSPRSAGDPDRRAYYRHWLAALERLVAEQAA